MKIILILSEQYKEGIIILETFYESGEITLLNNGMKSGRRKFAQYYINGKLA